VKNKTNSTNNTPSDSAISSVESSGSIKSLLKRTRVWTIIAIICTPLTIITVFIKPYYGTLAAPFDQFISSLAIIMQFPSSVMLLKCAYCDTSLPSTLNQSSNNSEQRIVNHYSSDRLKSKDNDIKQSNQNNNPIITNHDEIEIDIHYDQVDRNLLNDNNKEHILITCENNISISQEKEVEIIEDAPISIEEVQNDENDATCTY